MFLNVYSFSAYFIIIGWIWVHKGQTLHIYVAFFYIHIIYSSYFLNKTTVFNVDKTVNTIL